MIKMKVIAFSQDKFEVLNWLAKSVAACIYLEYNISR